MKRLLLLLALCCAAGAHADDAALRVVEACRAKLDARVDIGIERVRRRCPDLLPALEKAPWRELLPATLGDRREEISAESLRALAQLVRHAADPGAQRAAPERNTLDPVLAALGDQGQQGATRWERFKRWLKEKLQTRSALVQTGIGAAFSGAPGWVPAVEAAPEAVLALTHGRPGHSRRRPDGLPARARAGRRDRPAFEGRGHQAGRIGVVDPRHRRVVARLGRGAQGRPAVPRTSANRASLPDDCLL